MPRALDSILSQPVKSWEAIIIDDGSTDNTRKKIKNYLKNPRVKYFFKSHKGVGSARNYGIKKASGRYFVFLDSDDQFTPNAFKIFQKFFKKYSRINFFLFGTRNQYGKKWFQMPGRILKLNYQQFLIRSRIRGVFTQCFKRSIFKDKSLRFRHDLNGGESIFMLKVCRKNNALVINKIVSRIYLDTRHSLTHDLLTKKQVRNIYQANKATICEFGKDLKQFNHRSLGITYLVLARVSNLLGKYAKGFKYFRKGLKYYPKDPKRIILYFISFLDFKLILSNALIKFSKKLTILGSKIFKDS
ncbi:glycosyltransferase [Patescibacteria group bacterium]|nr:glycosyltransferase [Patescibacteria group bacterium]